MDKLDTLSAWAIAVLMLTIVGLVVMQSDEVHSTLGPVEEKHETVLLRPDQEKRIEIARDLLSNNSLEQFEELIKSLTEELPYESKLYMLQGEYHMRKQDPVAAMLAYRMAIDLNPDLLDKKAPDFQGKKIKVTVQEAAQEINKRFSQGPVQDELKQSKKTLYYMLRRIAGSCG